MRIWLYKELEARSCFYLCDPSVTLVDKEGILYKYEMWVNNQTVRIWEWGQTGQGSGVDLSSVGQGGKLLLWLEYLDKQSSANSWFERHLVSAELRKHCALHSCLGDFKAVGSLYQIS